MLKFEGTAKAGDYIRAYDFKPMRGRPDHYIEGEVIATTQPTASLGSYSAFVVACAVDTNHGSGLGSRPGPRVNDIILVPFEIGADYDCRVINLSE